MSRGRRRRTGRLNRAIRPESPLKEVIESGVSAIRAAHRRRMSPEVRETVSDSMDLDAAMLAEHPSDPRWDYLLGDPKGDRIVAIEPHPVAGGAATDVIGKKRFTERYLEQHLVSGERVDEWIWWASGKRAIAPASQQGRALARAGIRFVSGSLTRRKLG